MEAWVGGDGAAFRELFTRHAGLLVRVVGRGLPRADDASDLVQQTFLQLHRARLDYRLGTPLRPWLLTIAINVRRMHLRASGRRPEDLHAPETFPDLVAPAADPDAGERAARVRQAVEALPQDQRDVVWLHWFEGLSLVEVATVVGASHGAVKVRAHRAYEKLRGLLVAIDA